MAAIYPARDMTLKVRYRQPEPTNSWFGDHAHRRLRSVYRTCEADGNINFNKIYH
jgi:hypothetical protein